MIVTLLTLLMHHHQGLCRDGFTSPAKGIVHIAHVAQKDIAHAGRVIVVLKYDGEYMHALERKERDKMQSVCEKNEKHRCVESVPPPDCTLNTSLAL
jgi:hypothetical protein